MPLDPLTMSIAGGAMAANSLLNGFMQQRAAAYNQRMTEKNTLMNFKLSQEAQRNAAANEVAGLRAAGLSPVLANGAQGMSVSAGSSGTAQAPQVDAINSLLLKSQLDNIQAQTDKTKAEAKSTQLQNDIIEGHNKASGQNMKRYFTKMRADTTDSELIDYFDKQIAAASSSDYTVGQYQAFLESLDLEGKAEEAVARKADKKLSAWLAELRWNAAKGHTSDSSPFVKALVSLDARQSDLLAEQAAKLISERKNLDKDTDLIGAKISLTNEQIEQVKAAAAQLKDTNVMEFINQGDYGRALLAMVLQLFSGFAAKGPPL